MIIYLKNQFFPENAVDLLLNYLEHQIILVKYVLSRLMWAWLYFHIVSYFVTKLGNFEAGRKETLVSISRCSIFYEVIGMLESFEAYKRVY